MGLFQALGKQNYFYRNRLKDNIVEQIQSHCF